MTITKDETQTVKDFMVIRLKFKGFALETNLNKCSLAIASSVWPDHNVGISAMQYKHPGEHVRLRVAYRANYV